MKYHFLPRVLQTPYFNLEYIVIPRSYKWILQTPNTKCINRAKLAAVEGNKAPRAPSGNCRVFVWLSCFLQKSWWKITYQQPGKLWHEHRIIKKCFMKRGKVWQTERQTDRRIITVRFIVMSCSDYIKICLAIQIDEPLECITPKVVRMVWTGWINISPNLMLIQDQSE